MRRLPPALRTSNEWLGVCVCAGGEEGWYNHSHPKRERAFYQRMVMMYQPLLLLERRYLNLH